ncbi:MAG TPA: FlgD immunoglobulin-like domain containing protein, partial [Gaiellales bacterium]|nr:FlgD immunoglobulin-like domain containing protein [Gaiellales bacterium]
SPPMVSTRTATVVVGVLIAAAGAAFLRAEQLKLQRSPIAGPSIQRHFSATCTAGTRHCDPSHRAALSFRLRRPATIALAIVDSGGHVVRRLAGPMARPAGEVRTSWDGRTPAGHLAPDGEYRLRVELRSLGRTITIPDPLALDDTPPVITVESPAGAVPLRYTVSERCRVWAVARMADFTGPGDPPRASFRGRDGVVNFKPVRQIPAGTPINLVLVALDAAGNASAIVPVTGLHMPAG